MNDVSHRGFLVGASTLGVTVRAMATGNEVQDAASPAFRHGVASGDPLHDRVILWTRVTPSNRFDHVRVLWKVARDSRMRHYAD